MLILATLSGLQDYLFDVREMGGGQARSLRHRSFRIQLYAECLAMRLLDAANLPMSRLLFCAAAKVAIDAPSLDAQATSRLIDTVHDLEARLLRESHGRLRLAVVFQESEGSFHRTFEIGQRALARRKLSAYGGFNSAGVARSYRSPLVVDSLWDPTREAEQDAEIGRKLVTAKWLSIERSDEATQGDVEMLGLHVKLKESEPLASSGLLSCSNLQDPEAPPRLLDRKLFHTRRLARHIPRDDQGRAIEFVDLASQYSRGAPLLGVLKADVDGLGQAVADTLREVDNAAALRSLSEALDRFFAVTLEQEKLREGSPFTCVYTVFSGGDDMLAVGPWNVMLDFAQFAQSAFAERFGQQAKIKKTLHPLTLSAGLALIKPRYPIHFAAEQADLLLTRAKTEPALRAQQPKDQLASLGMVWKWQDHETILSAARQLADWVDTGTIQRGWLHTLLELVALRRGESPAASAGVSPAIATSRLAYHIGRNWPRREAKNPRQSEARRWVDRILDEFDRFESTSDVEAIYLPAILRYALLATRSSSSEDQR